ncbi:unnamed protein product [Polarella glacialis]|uniref:Peptidase C1A papain C-terminal domain-containing protein n=1 Tax=Polarella glacialis TaxID=89957 RepID=A0A813LKS3_POLGL|nr:unnamed protein product [Polarella glacialis]
MASAFCILAAIALVTATAGGQCAEGGCPAPKAAALLQRSKDHKNVERLVESGDLKLDSLNGSASVGGSSTKGFAGCPVNMGPLALQTWTAYFRRSCKVAFEDVPEKLKKALEGTPIVVEWDSGSCKVLVPYAVTGYGSGELSFQVVPSSASEEAWQPKVGTEMLEASAGSDSTCDKLFSAGTPTVAWLPESKVEKVFGQVRKDFAIACKDKNFSQYSMAMMTDLSSGLNVKRTMSFQESGGFMLRFEVSVDDLADSEVLEITVAEDVPTVSDVANQAFPANQMQVHEPASVSMASPAIGELRVLDDLTNPMLCCLCASCPDMKACDEGADSIETETVEVGASLIAHNAMLLNGTRTPGFGTPASRLPPHQKFHPDIAAHLATKEGRRPRSRAAPGFGDNFHSTVLPQRSSEDHERIWAQSRAFVHQVKADGIKVPDEYHFLDDDARASAALAGLLPLWALSKTDLHEGRRHMLLRCSEQNGACEGGNADKAYEDLMEIGGVWKSDCLPYQGKSVKHCPSFSYSWFGQESQGNTGKLARIDQEIMKSCDDLTRYSNRPPMGSEWDMPFTMMYETRFSMLPNVSDPRIARFKAGFARSRARDRVPSFWLYGEESMKAAVIKYGAIYASFIATKDFSERQCPTGCWPPGTVWGEEAQLEQSSCGGDGHAIHIIGYGTDIQETGVRGVKGFDKDPFTELYPMGADDQCVIGGCFAVEVDGTVVLNQDVAVGESGMFMKNISWTAGNHKVKFLLYAKNHPKQQAMPLETYHLSAVSIRCRGRGFGYSFTKNDANASLSGGRKTRAELRADADALLNGAGIQVNQRFEHCPEACRTGSFSAVIPCEGTLTTWGTCYMQSWATGFSARCIMADCVQCDETVLAQHVQGLATQAMSAESFSEWHTIVQQAFTAPDEPGWMRQFTSSCELESVGHNTNTQMTATYDLTTTNGADDAGGCDETHSAPFAPGQFVNAPRLMLEGTAAIQRCPMPLSGTVNLKCTGCVLQVGSHTCQERAILPDLSPEVRTIKEACTLLSSKETCKHNGQCSWDIITASCDMGRRGYFKIVRGVNYHGIESSAAFAIAEMTRFLELCPTNGWTKWSDCTVSVPCESGTQHRTRKPVNGFAKDHEGCKEVLFDESRPCVGPGFCSEVHARFMRSGSSDISTALLSYKTESSSLPYATAGAHMLESAYPSCDQAKYWCNLITGNEICTILYSGHFEVKKSADYFLRYEALEGGGELEFNSLGRGEETKPGYLVRAGNEGVGGEMFSWQDVGFHHRRRRTGTKPWQPVSSIYLEKGRYFAQMTRAEWSTCPDFKIVLEQATAKYAVPLLLGNLLGGASQNRVWSSTWGAMRRRRRSWDWGSRRRRTCENSPSNEIILRNAMGNVVLGRNIINKTSFTADELYSMFEIDKFNLPDTIRKYRRFELVMRTTFRYQQDTTADETNVGWRFSRRRHTTFVIRANSLTTAGVDEYQGSAVATASYVAHEAGEATFEVSIKLDLDGSDSKMTLPNSMQMMLKREDTLHTGSSGSLEFGSSIDLPSSLEALSGDMEVHIDWPDRDDPFSRMLSSNLAAGFMAEVDGGCRDEGGNFNFKGISLDLCDLDGTSQYLELSKLTGVNGTSRVDWILEGARRACHRYGYGVASTSAIRFEATAPRVIAVLRLGSASSDALALGPAPALGAIPVKGWDYAAKCKDYAARWDQEREPSPTAEVARHRLLVPYITALLRSAGSDSVLLHGPGFSATAPALRGCVGRLLYCVASDTVSEKQLWRRGFSVSRLSGDADVVLSVDEVLPTSAAGGSTSVELGLIDALVLLDDCGVAAWRAHWGALVAARLRAARARLRSEGSCDAHGFILILLCEGSDAAALPSFVEEFLVEAGGEPEATLDVRVSFKHGSRRWGFASLKLAVAEVGSGSELSLARSELQRRSCTSRGEGRDCFLMSWNYCVKSCGALGEAALMTCDAQPPASCSLASSKSVQYISHMTMANAFCILAAIALVTATAGAQCAEGGCPAPKAAALLQRSKDHKNVERLVESGDLKLDSLNGSASVGGSSTKGFAGCPVNMGPLALQTWTAYFRRSCKVAFEDVPEKLKKALEGTPIVVEWDSGSCKVLVPYAVTGYGSGELSFQVVPSSASEEAWQPKVGTEMLEASAGSDSTCDKLFSAGTPTVAWLPESKVEKVFGQVRKDFAIACKDKNFSQYSMAMMTDLSSGLNVKRTMSFQESGGFMLRFEVSVDDLADSEVLEITVAEDVPTVSDVANQAFPANQMQVHEPASVSMASPAIGELRVLDDLTRPMLCCLCASCPDMKACDEGADSIETETVEVGASLIAHSAMILNGTRTPGFGTPASRLPPHQKFHPDIAAHLATKEGRRPRSRAAPGFGDNFHSTVLPQRSSEDHERIWAQSRAFVHQVKADGIKVPDEYHFLDDDARARCFRPAYSQGECGSCWAFASLGALEKQICMRAGGTYAPSLSREMLLRCSEQNGACEGGNADKAYEDLMEIGGVWKSDCLPYQGKSVKHCPSFSYSWFGQESQGNTGKLARIDQEIMKSCDDLTRYSNRPPMGSEWDMPFTMMYETRFSMLPNVSDPRIARFKAGFARSRARDRVPSFWLYGEESMKAAVIKYGAIYASFIVMDDFSKRQCQTGCWPPGTVWGEEAQLEQSSCGDAKNGHAIHIIGYGTDIQETGVRVPYWLIENSWGSADQGNMFGEDSEGVKGFDKDPFTELYPMGADDQCVIGGWYSSKPKNPIIRSGIPVNGGEPDGFSFAVEVDGTVVLNQDVGVGESGMFMKNISWTAGNHKVKFLLYAKNHPKQQAMPLETYHLSAVSIRCRGRGFGYSFTKNDANASLSWGRKTRAELRADADALLNGAGIQVNQRFEHCPEACRTGSFSAVIPCEGTLATWGTCYMESSFSASYIRADCVQCNETALAQHVQGLATQAMSAESFSEWHTIVQQAFTAPDEPGWMRQFTSSCELESAGHNTNTQMTATYDLTTTNGADDAGGCDETHSAPFAPGQFVNAPRLMLEGTAATQRCPMPLSGTVNLRCTGGVLQVESHTCQERATLPDLSPEVRTIKEACTLLSSNETCKHNGQCSWDIITASCDIGRRGYFKIVRGVNYHGIESSAAFAIAEMTRFLELCPTNGWTKWSVCTVSVPCESGTQHRTREPVNGFAKDHEGCKDVQFDESRSCVGPGFCSEVHARFMRSGSSDISTALLSYKTESSSLPYATAGAHMLESAYPTCDQAKYWCNLITGNEICTILYSGHFEVKKSADYLLRYEALEGGGELEFNSLGRGEEKKPGYLVRAGSEGVGGEMFSWQDVGFHHRRRRTGTKPWQPVSSIYLEKGRYFAQMTRAEWSTCPDFEIALEQATAKYAVPLLLGNMLGGASQNRVWSNTWGAMSWSALYYRRHGYSWEPAAPATEDSPSNEIILRNAYGNVVLGRNIINKTSFTADELYSMFKIDKFNLPDTIKKSEQFELVMRTTVILPQKGLYKFRYQQDATADETNVGWRFESRRRHTKFVIRANSLTTAQVDEYQGSAVATASYVAHEAGAATFEVSIKLDIDGSDGKMTLPNSMQMMLKREDTLHTGSSGSLEFGSSIDHPSSLEALSGDMEVRIDWPDRDDPFSSELRTSTFKDVERGAILIGKSNLAAGFMAEVDGVIDAGACLSLEARVVGMKEATSNFKGISLDLCDLDGTSQYLELSKLTGVNGTTRGRIGWVHIGFTQSTHLRFVRDPTDPTKIEVSYRPDDRLQYALPFSTNDITAAMEGYTGPMDVGISMMSPESYRYAEFYNITIEECPASCDVSGQQVLCGEIRSACDTTLFCNSTCAGGGTCWNSMCMQCPILALPDELLNAECGTLGQICTNPDGQQIQVQQNIGVPRPSPAHHCANNSWMCAAGLTKWAYLAEGKQCGNVTDECGVEVDLFACPRVRDVCQAHRCSCQPRSFSAEKICGWEADGCGLNVIFGSLQGLCPKEFHRCIDHTCCSPKTVADFNGSYQCGKESDGCNGYIYFKAPTAQEVPFFSDEVRSFETDTQTLEVGMEFEASSNFVLTSLGRGLPSDKTALLENTLLTLWSVATKEKLATVTVGPESTVSNGYASEPLVEAISVVQGTLYRLSLQSNEGTLDYYSTGWQTGNMSSHAIWKGQVQGTVKGKYPTSGPSANSGYGMVTFGILANEGCESSAFECQANHTCTKKVLPDGFTSDGPCTVTHDGYCVSSPNFPAKYNTREICTITVEPGITVNAMTFETESGYDFLNIGGSELSGSKSGSQFDTGDGTITWSSDGSVVQTGWQICVDGFGVLLQESSASHPQPKKLTPAEEKEAERKQQARK